MLAPLLPPAVASIMVNMDFCMANLRASGRDWLDISGNRALVAFFVVCGISFYPVFSHDFVSINDLYNHVAGAAVLAHYRDLAAFKTYWLPNWQFVPYLAFDVAAGGLMSWFTMGFVAKLMVSFSLLTLFAGTVLLSRIVHGRWSAVSLLGGLLLMNRMLLSGLINYLFGLGLGLLGVSAWIVLRDKPVLVRMVVLTAFATATCAIHLLACGVFGVIVGGVELAILLERRAGLVQCLTSLAVVAAAFVPSLVLVVLVAPHPDYYGFIVYSGLGSRLAAFAAPLTYAPAEEAVGFAAIGAAVLAFWITGRMRLDRRLAAAAGLLALVQLVMPESIGAATAVDHRVPIAVWIIFFCALEIRVERASLAVGFMLLVSAVFLGRVALTEMWWTRQDRFYAEAVKDLKLLPDNARVGTAYPESALKSAAGPAIALYYLPVWQFVPKGGFTQTVFTRPDQHPLVMQPSFEQLDIAAYPAAIWNLFVAPPEDEEPPAERSQALAAVMAYDYLVFLDPKSFDLGPTSLLELVRAGPGIRIYKVRHDQPASIQDGASRS